MGIVTTYFVTDLLILFTTFAFAVYLYATRKFNYWKNKGVPYKRPIPFFGNFKESTLFKKAPGEFLAEAYKDTEEDFSGFYLFDQPCLILKNTDLIKSIFIRDFNYFHDRYVADNLRDDPAGTYNLFNAKNPVWRELRTKITPIFTSGKLKQMFSLVEQNGDDLIKHIKNKVMTTESEDVKDVAAKYVIDVLINTVFGVEANCLSDDNSPFWLAGENALTFTFKRSIQFFSYFFAPNLVKLFRFKFIDGQACEFLRNMFTDSMKLRMESGVKRNDLIDILLKMKNGK